MCEEPIKKHLKQTPQDSLMTIEESISYVDSSPKETLRQYQDLLARAPGLDQQWGSQCQKEAQREESARQQREGSNKVN